MGVYIKGLNIEKCGDGYDGNGLVIIGYDDKLYAVKHKNIIPVPDHGDLIDRDKVKGKAHKLPNGYNHGYFQKCVDELFNYAPVVIPADRSE